MKMNDFLWVEKYRPHKIDDVILPEDLKNTFRQYVKDGNIPNMILEGPAGCGKTTLAMAMLDEIGADYIMINGSLDRNIDVLRNEIQTFASSVSLTGKRKYVILDEADGLNPQSMQPALKNFIEKFSKNCGFIMTCNHLHKIIEPLHSRNSIISFKLKKKELPGLAAQFLKRCCSILEAEGIQFEKEAVIEVIKKFLPDWRRTLNELQRYSATGKIDTGIIAKIQELSISDLIGYLKEKDFTNMRKWVGENLDGDCAHLYRQIYDSASTFMEKSSIPMLVVILAKYQFQAAFVADPEINTVAFLTEVMMDCSFK